MARVGRPSKMTKETLEKMENALIGCCSIEDACAYADINYETFRVWQSKARRDEKEGKISEYTAFIGAINQAKAKAKPRLILLISKAAERNPKIALEMLERRYPKEWGIKSFVETRDRTGEPEPRDEDVLPAILEILDEFPDAKMKLTKRLEELK